MVSIKDESVPMNAYIAVNENMGSQWNITTSMGLKPAQAWTNIQGHRFGFGFPVFFKETGEHRHYVKCPQCHWTYDSLEIGECWKWSIVGMCQTIQGAGLDSRTWLPIGICVVAHMFEASIMFEYHQSALQ